MRILVLFTLLLVQSCVDKFERCPTYFELPAEIFPAKRVFKIGDTILFYSKFPTMLSALNSMGEDIGKYDTRDVRWDPTTHIYRIDTIENINIPDWSGNLNYFKYLKDSLSNYFPFVYSKGDASYSGQFVSIQDSHYLAFAIVCTSPGTYYMNNVNGAFLRSDPFPGWCFSLKYDASIVVNNGADNNYDLLFTAVDSFFIKHSARENGKYFHKFGGYCFQVVP